MTRRGLLPAAMLAAAATVPGCSPEPASRPASVEKAPPSSAAISEPPPIAVVPEPVPVPAAPPPLPSLTPAPWQLHAASLHRWDGDGWKVRLNLLVRRVREAPAGALLGAKLACTVAGARVADLAAITAPPAAPIGLGEAGPAYADFFMYAPMPGVPAQCELMLYVHRAGSASEHVDAGRACIVPDGKTYAVTIGPCPIQLEQP